MFNLPFMNPTVQIAKGPKQIIKFDQITTPKFEANIDTLKSYSVSIKAIFSDLMMKTIAGILVPKNIRRTHRVVMDSIQRDGFTLEVRWSKATHEVVIFEPILMVEWTRRGGFGSKSKMLKEYIAHTQATPTFIQACREALETTKMSRKQRNVYVELLAWHNV